MSESGALDAVDRIVNRGGEADDVLRAAVAVLPEQLPTIRWAGIYAMRQPTPLVEAGEPGKEPRLHVPIVLRGEQLGVLQVEGRAPIPFLERVAILVSAHLPKSSS